jgi:hypothetical protein
VYWNIRVKCRKSSIQRVRAKAEKEGRKKSFFLCSLMGVQLLLRNEFSLICCSHGLRLEITNCFSLQKSLANSIMCGYRMHFEEQPWLDFFCFYLFIYLFFLIIQFPIVYLLITANTIPSKPQVCFHQMCRVDDAHTILY